MITRTTAQPPIMRMNVPSVDGLRLHALSKSLWDFISPYPAQSSAFDFGLRALHCHAFKTVQSAADSLHAILRLVQFILGAQQGQFGGGDLAVEILCNVDFKHGVFS